MNLPKRAGVTVTAGVICAALISGCASSHSAQPVAAVATPTLSSVLEARLPIAAYELTASQSAEENYLQQQLRQSCMREFGFDLLPGLSTKVISQGIRVTQEVESRRYGVTNPVDARTYGYHLPTWIVGSAPPATVASLPPAERSVFIGTAKTYRGRPIPTGGCFTQAADELAQAGIGAATQSSGGSDPSALVGQIRRTDFERAQSDPRVLAVFARWSACMRSNGYSYRTPFDANGDRRWSTSAPPGALEIQIAEHDVSCKLLVNLLGVEFAVESDYENADIATNAAAMAAVKTEVADEAASIARTMAQYAT
jgi:hypothetical protein